MKYLIRFCLGKDTKKNESSFDLSQKNDADEPFFLSSGVNNGFFRINFALLLTDYR